MPKNPGFRPTTHWYDDLCNCTNCRERSQFKTVLTISTYADGNMPPWKVTVPEPYQAGE